MADIRINALATTAASTASDDFVAVDGSANGTRKLNAYNPTFGGNVTASGNLTVSGGSTSGQAFFNSAGSYGFIQLTDAGSTAGNALIGTGAMAAGASVGDVTIRQNNDSKAFLVSGVNDNWFKVTSSAATILGNLTVSGGTIGTAAATNLTLNGGSSGASLVLGQGTNGAPTLAAAGSGTPTITKLGAANGARRVALNLQTGADGTLGPVNIELAAYPSATGAQRYGSISVGDSGAWRPLVLQHAGGNVLVGATADGGNGIIQLATHTTSAGGIGFGADVSLYRSNAGYLTLLGTASLVSQYFRVGSQNMGYLYFDTTDGYVSTSKAGASLVLRSGNEATALTLDSSQNATFAGNALVKSFVTLAGPTSGTSFLHWKETSVADRGVLGFEAGSSTLKYRAGGYSMATGTEVFSISSTGAIAIGNTVQTAVGVASTHKVTISIGGSTYYLLATNV